jgi:hypothetical protein
MTKLYAYLKIALAFLLYIISAFTVLDTMYSLVIPDTVTAVENAFGKFVILIFMLVLAKFSLTAGKAQLKGQLNGEQGDSTKQSEPIDANDTSHLNNPDSVIQGPGKEADK